MASITPSVAHPFLGMDIHKALAVARVDGKTLRVMINHGVALRYAEDPDPEHIKVEVHAGVVTHAY